MRLRHPLLIYCFYLAIAVIITYPLVTQLSTHLLGNPLGDATEYTRHIWWITHALKTGQPIFENPLLLYPDGLSGALLWSIPLQSFPAWALALILPVGVAFNLTVLLFLTLNGWAMFVLLRYLLRAQAHATLPALFGGVIYLAYPTFQGHIGAAHIGLLALWGAPLFMYGVLRLIEQAQFSRKWAAFTGVFFCVSVLGSTTLLIYMTAPLTLGLLITLIFRRDWGALRRVIPALVFGCALMAIFLLPALRDATTTLSSALTSAENATRYSASLLSFSAPSFLHPVYGALEYPAQVIGREPFENIAYVGVLSGILALVGVIKFRVARGWLILALIAYIFSLGAILKLFEAPLTVTFEGIHTYIVMPYFFIQDFPVINLARTPARFNFTVALCMAVMASYGAAWLLSKLNRKAATALFVAVSAFTLFDYQVFWGVDTIPTPPTLPSTTRAIFSIPFENPLVDKEALYLQTAHHSPIIGGHIARETPLNPAKGYLLQNTLDPALLDAAGVDAIIIHRTWDTNGRYETNARAQFGAPVYQDDQYAYFAISPSNSAPTFMSIPFAERIETTQSAYFYAPQAGWAQLEVTMQADQASRAVNVMHNGAIIHTYHSTVDEMRFALNVPVNEGYHTLTLALDPPCPVAYPAALTCNGVNINAQSLRFSEGTTALNVEFEGGKTLESAFVQSSDEGLMVSLAWAFDVPPTENMIRFIHLVDATGTPIAQLDTPIISEQARFVEMQTLPLPRDLPTGEYRVFVGWYQFVEGEQFVNALINANAPTSSLPHAALIGTVER